MPVRRPPSTATPDRGDLLRATPLGLECAAGAFHVDPFEPVPRAIVTHAHTDHLVPGCGSYLCSAPSAPLLRRVIGDDATVEALAYGERRVLGEVAVSLHPAGHILGSAQVRIERGGETWVVSGDFKRQSDPTCEPFEVVPCDVFVSEATFALPIYRWEPGATVAREILAWWDANRAAGRAAVLFAYALGKAQRVLAELAVLTDRPVWVHGALAAMTEAYRRHGVKMLPTRAEAEAPRGTSFAGELVMAPPSARGSAWLRRFGEQETALASGWMRVRGARRRRGFDRGFALSDHADWPALVATARETGARRVLTVHGSADTLARYLNETGIAAAPLLPGWRRGAAADTEKVDNTAAAVDPDS